MSFRREDLQHFANIIFIWLYVCKINATTGIILLLLGNCKLGVCGYTTSAVKLHSKALSAGQSQRTSDLIKNFIESWCFRLCFYIIV